MRGETVGKPINRVDGPLKVAGLARYAAEFHLPNVAHAVLVQSTISNGRVTSIETTEAQKLPGVLAVITHKNAPQLPQISKDRKGGGMAGTNLQPLQSDDVHYDGQHLAVVVADTLENAQHAAGLVKIKYDTHPADFEIDTASRPPNRAPESFGRPLLVQRGNVNTALAKAHTVLEQTYVTPVENHNPIELSATVAAWDGERLTIYNATQGIVGDRRMVAEMLGIPQENVRVVCPFVGGGFGCKGSTWPHTILAAVAAQKIGRPVKLVLTRPQMFSSVGHRGKTVQRITLGADDKGKLTAIRHATRTEASIDNEFIEAAGLSTAILYANPNLDVSHELYKLNIAPTAQMRAPGEAPGTYALECALDELAHKLRLDPLELRLRNHADNDPQENRAWSSKHLKECYSKAAEAFGWSKRNPEPRSMREGNVLIGWGMATATYPGNRSAASAKARMTADGVLTVESATQDIGTGTYTIMSQIAADAMGVPIEKVRFELGDSLYPRAPVSGGSQTAASVGPAVQQAVEELRNKLIRLSLDADNSPLKGIAPAQLAWSDSRLYLKSDEKKGETYAEIVKRSGKREIEAEATAELTTKEALTREVNVSVNESAQRSETKKDEFSFWSWGAQFAEVRVDPELCTVRVSRVVSAFDVGRVLNEKTARSQAIGGIVGGIGAALMEETVRDPKTGRLVNANLADYRVPVNADIPEIRVLFVDQPDPHINAIGARGLGEIGITGITASIANAVFHATGKRVRDLPITIEKLL